MDARRIDAGFAGSAIACCRDLRGLQETNMSCSMNRMFAAHGFSAGFGAVSAAGLWTGTDAQPDGRPVARQVWRTVSAASEIAAVENR